MKLPSSALAALFTALLLEPVVVRAHWRRPIVRNPFINLSASASSPPQVVLPDGTGTVTGVLDVPNAQDAFLGIPFAQPPTGDLRFAKPVAVSPDSSRAISATQFGYICLQASVGLDCSFCSLGCLRPKLPSELESSSIRHVRRLSDAERASPNRIACQRQPPRHGLDIRRRICQRCCGGL